MSIPSAFRPLLFALFTLTPTEAAAQAVTQGDLSYSAPSCQALGKGAVDCVQTVTYRGAKASSTAIVDPRNTRAFAPTGQVYYPGSATSDGREIAGTFANLLLPAGVPVKVTYHFKELPGPLTSFSALTFSGLTFKSLKFAGTGADAPAPAPQAPPTGIPSGYAITLSKCVPQGASYTCMASLTPVR